MRQPPRARGLLGGLSAVLSAIRGRLADGLAVEGAEPREDHLTRHVDAMREFQTLLADDPAAALAAAQADVAEARELRLNDPRRGDALERLALALAAAERYPAGLDAATETVRIRKAARPPSEELIGLALGTHAMLLFANDHAEQADAALREALVHWRRAYGPGDLRLAQKLEGQAEFAQAGFRRTHWVIELLEEAVQIRRSAGDGSPGRLAQTLQGLATHQLTIGEFAKAAANLEAAHALLEGEPGDEARAGRVQMLMLQSGVALRLASYDAALDLANQAAAIEVNDPMARIEAVAPLALLRCAILEAQGDIDAASNALVDAIETLGEHQDLVGQAVLDRELAVDLLAELTAFDLRHGLLEEAGEALALVRHARGDTSDVLLLASELARQTGDASAALHRYQRAMQLRRVEVTEIKVHFGTTRRQTRQAPPAFGTEAGDLTLGEALVLVPGGQFSTEAWLPNRTPLPMPVGEATNPTQLLIRELRVLTAPDFAADMARVAGAARVYSGAALVFVHGYNVGFEAAVRRAAQLARDLDVDGPVAVFAWPSRGVMWRYGTDRITADAAADQLVAFLRHVLEGAGATRLHLVAHSMGNRVLLPALQTIAAARDDLAASLGEVILAAPAVPQTAFVDAMNTLADAGLRRVTLYASAADKALLAGYFREWGTALAGRVASGEPLTHPIVQSIDLSSASTGDGLFDLNHDTFAANPVIAEDMRRLLQRGTRPPHERLPTLALATGAGGREYWVYRAIG